MGRDGLPVDGLARALDGVYLDLAPISLDAGAEYAEAARALLRLFTGSAVAPETARASLGADPLGHEARTGEALDPADAVELAREAAMRLAGRARPDRGRAALPRGRMGSAAEELGLSLATGVAYLRALTEGA